MGDSSPGRPREGRGRGHLLISLTSLSTHCMAFGLFISPANFGNSELSFCYYLGT